MLSLIRNSSLLDSATRSCLSCSNYMRCDDALKGIDHLCKRYTSNRESIANFDALMADVSKAAAQDTELAPLVETFDSHAASTSIKAQITQALNDNKMVSPDVRLPERDFPEAPNFLEWCLDKRFLGQAPFAAQAYLGIKLFADYCPDCSDVNWFEGGFDVADPPEIFRERMSLLHNGICPKCKGTRAQFVKQKKLNFYYEAAVSAGQRCVTGDTLVLTASGIRRISSFAKSRPDGFSELHIPVHSGEYGVRETEAFFISKPERVYKLALRTGRTLRGTCDHPVKTFHGFKRLADLNIGDGVMCKIGTELWGNSVPLIPELVDRAASKFEARYGTKDSKAAGGQPTHTILNDNIRFDSDLATLLGLWVAEGRGSGITNYDQDIINFVIAQYARLFTARYVRFEYREVRGARIPITVKVRGKRGEFLLEELLGQDLFSGSAKKRVPQCILSGTRSNAVAFLRGLFEGDGTVEASVVTYCTISRRLAEEVSVLLDNLGIASVMRVTEKTASNGTENQSPCTCHTLSIAGKYLAKFAETVGFISSRKAEALAALIEDQEERALDMPHFYDKYTEDIKSSFLSVVSAAVSQLSALRKPAFVYTETRRGAQKKSGYYGLETVLPLVGGITSDTVKQLMSKGNVCLTRKKMREISSAFLDHGHLLSRSVAAELQTYLDLANDDTIIVSPVKSLKLSRTEHVTYDFTVKDVHQFVSNGIVSHNSGKSAWTSMVASYLTHKIIKMEKPTEIYGVMRGQPLQGTFVALTYAQAKDTLWEPLYSVFLESDWYRNYHAMLDDYGQRYGEEIYRLKDTFIQYRHRNFQFYPAGPDKRVLRGRTRAMACLTADTLVSTNIGLIKIDRDSIGLRTHVGNREFGIVNWSYTGDKLVRKLTLANGQTIRATDNHEFKTSAGRKRLDELTTNDEVLVSVGGEFPEALCLNYEPEVDSTEAQIYRKIDELETFDSLSFEGCGRTRNSLSVLVSSMCRAGHLKRTYYKGRTGADGLPRCFYEKTETFDLDSLLAEELGRSSYERRRTIFPKKMTPALASLIGYLVADGSYTGESEVQFSTSVKARARHFAACFNEVFGYKPRQSKYRSSMGAEMVKFSLAYKTHIDFLRYLGLDPVRSHKKQIPWSILQADIESTRAFLTAAFDCDGGARGKSHGRYVFYDTASPKLARQMQIVLMRLGIMSKIVKLTRSELCTIYSVRMRDPEHIDLWFSEVGSLTGDSVDLDALNREKPETAFRHVGDGVYAVRVSRISDKRVKAPVYDITVDDEDHFFTGNGMVVSNSIDELGWFPNDAAAAKNIKMNATEVYVALERSLRTVRSAADDLLERGFSNLMHGYFVNISSPSSARDKIMELVRQSQGSSKIFGVIKPTWEMNPRQTRAHLAEEFRKDPVAAMRDYGAQPPLSSSPFITSKTAVEDAASKKKANPIRLTYKQHKLRDNSTELYAIPTISQKALHGKPAVLALDAGYSNNSFAAALLHEEIHEDQPRIICDLMCEVQPVPGTPLNHGLIYRELLAEILSDYNVVALAADRWQSLKLLADAELEFGITKIQHSLTFAEMSLYKSFLFDGQFFYPKMESDMESVILYEQDHYPACFKNRPIDHFVLQNLTVQSTGSTVVKGDNLTDDLLRAVMLGVAVLRNPKYAEVFQEAEEEEVEAQRKPQPAASSIFMKTLGTTGVRQASTPTGGRGGVTIGVARRRG